MEDYIAAHKYCINNRNQLEKDTKCGCFHCLKIFDPVEITEWLEDETGTALCPYCGIDLIIGNYMGFPITTDFLKKMNEHWFEE